MTNDLRATSDPLWAALHRFHKWILEAGVRTVREWHSLLVDIRELAWDARLFSSDFQPREVWIDHREALEISGFEGLPRELTGHVIVFITEYGTWMDADLDVGIGAYRRWNTDKLQRELAAKWAESWMNARERQLVGTTPSVVSPGSSKDTAISASASKQDDDGLRLGTWFAKATSNYLSSDMLRKAVSRGTLERSQKAPAGGRWRHSIDEVCKIWPDVAGQIQIYYGHVRTKPDNPGQFAE